MESLLSFCIVTYNRKRKVMELVNRILTNQTSELEVVVVDDCSTDGTVKALQCIEDNRLHVYQNSVRQGANRNWYISLSKGNGKYLFQVLDRDWINPECIDKIIDILRKEEVGFGYAGISIVTDAKEGRNEYQVYKKGMDAAKMFACVPVHPTGVIFSRDLWMKCKNKVTYFDEEKWGVYPHSYIYAIMSQVSDAIRINIDICDKKRSSQLRRSVSRYYSTFSDHYEFWWTPKARFQEFLLERKMIERLKFNQSEKEELIIRRYEDELFLSTIVYRYLLQDREHTRHYQISPENKGKIELIVIAFGFFFSVIKSGVVRGLEKEGKRALLVRTLHMVKLILFETVKSV